MARLADFVIDQSPLRIVFGDNSRAKLADEIAALGAERVLVVTTPRGAKGLDQLTLGDNVVGVFDESKQHVPEATAAAATKVAQQLNCDALIAFGGGSPVGVAKAVALEHDAVIIAVPTTYAGSEMTNIYGITSDAGKRTGRDERVRPRTVIYDPQLTANLPLGLTMTSGFNAMAHAVEALYAEAVDPITLLVAKQGVASLASALAKIADDPHDADGRNEALYGAFLSGWCLTNAGVALHHKLCHVLGGSYGLAHAPTHTIILPHAVHYNRVGAPDAIAQVANALAVDEAGPGLFELIRKVGAPFALKDIGMAEADLDDAADRAMNNAYYNPTPLDRGKIRALLDDAFFGRPPGSS